MRRTLLILALATLNAHAVNCIRATFDYYASQYMPEDDIKTYILPGDLTPDSLSQEEKSLILTVKYHWTGNHLDKLDISHSCLDDEVKGINIPNGTVDSTRMGKLTRYNWTFPDKSSNFTVYRGMDSVDIVYGPEKEPAHHTFYIKNDTIYDVNDWLPRKWITFRNGNSCIRAKEIEKKLEDGSVQKAVGEIYATYEYETRGDFLIQEIFEPDYTKYIMPPGPCDGGDKSTTIYYRKKK